MKQIFFSLVAMLPVALLAQSDSTKLMLPQGTIITVAILQDISSGDAKTGDILEFETTEPVIINDRVLVKKGSKVSGKVTEAAGRKGMGKAGKLNFSIDYLTMPNGKNVKLTTELKADGKNKTGTAVAEAVLLTPLFLLKKGKNIKYEKGHIFKAFVDEDFSL